MNLYFHHFYLRSCQAKKAALMNDLQGRSTVQQGKAMRTNDVGGQVGITAVMLGKPVEIIEGNIVGIIVA